jgi:hypothetical protein
MEGSVAVLFMRKILRTRERQGELPSFHPRLARRFISTDLSVGPESVAIILTIS